MGSINKRRIKLEKAIKDLEEIKDFLKKPENKKEIFNLIEKNMSETNKLFFGVSDFYSLLTTDVDKIEKRLRLTRRKSYAVYLLDKFGLLYLVNPFINSMGDKKFAEEIKIFFADFPELDSLLKELKNIQGEFLLDCKKSNNLRNKALNRVDLDEKIFGLDEALKIGRLGSVEASLIIRDSILLKNGRIIGKTKESLALDDKNKKIQKAIA